MEEVVIAGRTVESVLIDLGQIDRIYKPGKAPTLSLWRALRTDQPGGTLYPDFHERELRLGKFRPPDVTVEIIAGVECVVPKIYKKRPEDPWKVQGTSLFDRPDTFVGDRWWYFEIPAGTVIPEGLLIVKDDYNERFGATHYCIAPNRTMPVFHLKLLLDQLAKNATAAKARSA